MLVPGWAGGTSQLLRGRARPPGALGFTESIISLSTWQFPGEAAAEIYWLFHAPACPSSLPEVFLHSPSTWSDSHGTAGYLRHHLSAFRLPGLWVSLGHVPCEGIR